MSASWNGYGGVFSLTHALVQDCHKVGLVTQCHDGVIDTLGDLVALGYREVVHEYYV